MTIIKILISVPTILLIGNNEVNGAALMGGHLDNKNNESTPSLTDYDFYDNREITGNNTVSEAVLNDDVINNLFLSARIYPKKTKSHFSNQK